jgi:RimJ/RimL family protein N-acetyltransferase
LAAVIETERLLVRAWHDEDVAPFSILNSDPEVLRFLGIGGTPEESRAFVARQQAMQAELGHCLWALERKEDYALLGFCGVRPGVPDTPIAGELEIGWRLGSGSWGRGYAREAAAACLDWSFESRGVPRVVAITVEANARSRRLMERLEMIRRPELDFLHPLLPDGHPLKPHLTHVRDRP